MSLRSACLALALGLAASFAPAAQPSHDGVLLPRDSHDAAVFRGGLVFANYCVTCHGVTGDGNGRAGSRTLVDKLQRPDAGDPDRRSAGPQP